jgi:DNA polymerase I-like protein with 3'-5' exonuclease and polymerase domains
MEAKLHKADLIATTDFKVFKLFDPSLEGSSNESVGAVVVCQGIRVILLPRLCDIFKVSHQRFLIDHFCKKLAFGGILHKDPFRWEFVTPSTLATVKDAVDSSFLTGVDIETSKDGLRITSVAYCTSTLFQGELTTRCYVVPCSFQDYPFCIDAIRVLNDTASPKVMQNGQYDSTYFIRFRAPLHNYIYDTATLSHAIYCELPKDLAFVSSFYLDNYRFWKDESGHNLYEYNAKDAHNTLWVFLAQILHAPEYAFTNYLAIFPVNFPALSCALEGMEVVPEIKDKLRAAEVEKQTEALSRIQYLLDTPNFNPGSPPQVMQMFHAVGYKDAKSSDKVEMRKFKEAKPIYARLANLIADYRSATKAISTYFDMSLMQDPANLYPPRIMYKLDPSGTETGRMASSSSNFWCGANIQNMPGYARKMVKAEDGWIFGAVDKSQSESYCTAYLSQDLNLIHSVTTSPDFHCKNASLFFGIPFSELYDAANKKVLNKPIRTLAKRVNHGANYNMMGNKLLETMGDLEVVKAKALLKLPSNWSLVTVCEYLLECFDSQYPQVRGPWYQQITQEVVTTGLLANPTGYTRRTFLQPKKSKLDLNACVAHKPQSLSVELVNKAFYRIWRELQLGKYYGKFRLKAQVHDEIIFIATPDIIEEALEDVANYMVIPTKIYGRTMTIPSTKVSGLYWSDLKD